ncbi:smoothelin-like protein 1 [Brienomyrus brachyistius]|uniref:smoothelin-like protein 1 n=1 Tax=Brienomyrus brachyistius TaxID=42636 RepID=UPI0020B2590D|nr:smoothelin-like protein 1 [Brienomyrus brachyistius]
MSISVAIQVKGGRSTSGPGHSTEITADKAAQPELEKDPAPLGMEAVSPSCSAAVVSCKHDQQDLNEQEKEQKGQPGGGAEELMVRGRGRMTDECLPRKSGRHGPDRRSIQTSHQQGSSSITKLAYSPLQPGKQTRGGLAELECRQAEKRKEMMKPKSFSAPSPRALAQQLESESTGAAGPAVVRIQRPGRSPGSGTNNKNVKQMLLDWCRAKTQMYENVHIQNFSSSWADGLAFCALVHNFFPQAFDYNALDPRQRRHNFHTAFSAAEQQANVPRLLEVDDLVRMKEPDWKCVYTYIQEFYRCLVDKGLVKIKKPT